MITVLVHVLTTVVDVLIDGGLAPPEGRLTPAALHAARAEVRAAEAVDAQIGLTGRLMAEGVIAPLAAVLRAAEHGHPCAHAARAAPEEAP